MEVFGIIFALIWYAVGFYGLYLARQKGHLQWFKGMGCAMFFTYGWVVALIFIFIPGILGPFMWLIAKYVMADKATPRSFGDRPQ